MTTKNYLQKKGMTQKQSNIVMIGVIILCVIFIFFIFKKNKTNVPDIDNTLSVEEKELIELTNRELLNEEKKK